MNHFGLLLNLKLTILKNAFRRLRKRSQIEFLTLVFFYLAAGFGLFLFFFHSFRFFRAQEPFGPILVDEAFYLLTFAMFLMLLISSAVSAYTSLFQSKEVPFLLTHTVTWPEIYFTKLIEAFWFSSWAVLFVAIPFMAAYGINKNADPVLFPLLCLIFFVPFVILTGILGTLVSTIVVWLLPSRRLRKIALIGVLIATAFLFFRTRPEIIKEQGSIAGIMSGYLPHVAFAKNPLLPSSWTAKGILALSNIESRETLSAAEGLFYFLLLLSNTLFFLIPSYSAAKRLYPRTFLRVQDHAHMQLARRVKLRKGFERWLDRLPWPPRPVMAFLEKDLKTFARDPAEWSQLIIFFGLLVLYFLNLKNLEFHVLKSFWKNLVFILNTVGTYIVLSSFNMRFVFPMLSLEGSRFWIIGLSPIRFSALLLEKFLLGTVISLVLTMPLVFLSGWMLEIPMARVLYTTGLGFFVCVALTGLSVGLGAKFPNFESTNPSEIISGFGGSALLVAHLTYLALIGAFLMITKEPHWLTFWMMAAGSLLVGSVPLRIGVRALKGMEFR